ncbi:uncharacterized protein LOC119608914 isoform X2 [Lucilia sericata]|uniref:uncharacterized protein LOC119608914 isoform X2 n=1 Tax=Lucilia sericata TaxID=13632 RepID=UPI0018A8598F|nr:uncharacterized protein LOC119608914 isoform X2 [Lucilia sericata]
MFSKFAVLSKIFRYSLFKHNGLRRILRCECGSIMTRQRCFSKDSQNKSLKLQDSRNVKSLHFNKEVQFNISRNIMSSNSKDGDGTQIQNAAKVKKLIEKRKKKILRRRSKVKILKASQMKCKRCKSNKLTDDPKTENFINKTVLQTTDLSIKKGSSKMEIPELNNNPGISQSHMPPKKVHVEFMESQNLKDFNLNKTPTLELNRNNSKQNVIEIKIKPINLSDRKPSNVKSIELNIKNTIHNLETQHLTKSNYDYQNKKMLKSGDNNSVKVPIAEDPIMANENSLKSKKNSLHKAVSNDISKQNNSTVTKKSENIRILYQAHPKRKTKVRIPKLMKSEKTTRTKPYEEDKTKKVALANQPSNVPSQRKGILFPTEPGEFLNFKIQSKNLTTDIKPFVTTEKGILYPTEKCDTNLLKISTTKKDLHSAQTENKAVIPEDNPAPKLAENNQQLNYSKSTSSSKMSTEGNSKGDSSSNFLKSATNPKLETVKHPINNPVADSSGSNIKDILAFQANEESKSSFKKATSVNNSLNELKIYRDKLKNEDTNLIAANTVPQSARTAPKTVTKESLATIKTNKLTKSKRSSRGGNRGGNQSGGRGHKTTINKEATTTFKERPSRFWRTISFTILPLILGLTVYTMSNIGAAEMFKRLRNTRSSEDPLSWKMLPTFYGKKSNDDLTELNDIESEEQDDEKPLNESKNENEQLETYFKDPRLNEA